MTVHEVSKLTGVSVRTLQYYDKIGLLPPAKYTDAGYRLYDKAALSRLQQILLFRELEFSLKEIKAILGDPRFDRRKAIRQQIELLTLKKEHLENLIAFARTLEKTGGNAMDFSAFDKSRLDEYAKQAKEQWGQTDAYMEYEEKSKDRSSEMEVVLGHGVLDIFAEFGEIRETDPDSPEAQALVKKLQSYITEHFYRCTPEILASLADMYDAGGEYTANIDKVGGEGTAHFAAEAIRIYCERA